MCADELMDDVQMGPRWPALSRFRSTINFFILLTPHFLYCSKIHVKYLVLCLNLADKFRYLQNCRQRLCSWPLKFWSKLEVWVEFRLYLKQKIPMVLMIHHHFVLTYHTTPNVIQTSSPWNICVDWFENSSNCESFPLPMFHLWICLRRGFSQPFSSFYCTFTWWQAQIIAAPWGNLFQPSSGLRGSIHSGRLSANGTELNTTINSSLELEERSRKKPAYTSYAVWLYH